MLKQYVQCGISHIVEMVVSTMNMISRLGRWSFMYCAIAACRTQLSIDFQQHCLAQLRFPDRWILGRETPPHRFPYCQRRPSVQATECALWRSRFDFET